MKVWKWVAITLMLCVAALSIFLSKSLLSPRLLASHHFGLSSSLSSKLSSSASTTILNNSFSETEGKVRQVRSAHSSDLIITEVMQLFQSFTDSELKQVIGALVQRKTLRNTKRGKRSKRAKNGGKPCSLQKIEVTVSQLGLGYLSDEIISFRYCSGRCSTSRRNYDLALSFLKRKKSLDRARHNPCCRPTEYEKDTVFLNNNYRYQSIREISALKCGCV